MTSTDKQLQLRKISYDRLLNFKRQDDFISLMNGFILQLVKKIDTTRSFQFITIDAVYLNKLSLSISKNDQLALLFKQLIKNDGYCFIESVGYGNYNFLYNVYLSSDFNLVLDLGLFMKENNILYYLFKTLNLQDVSLQDVFSQTIYLNHLSFFISNHSLVTLYQSSELQDNVDLIYQEFLDLYYAVRMSLQLSLP